MIFFLNSYGFLWKIHKDFSEIYRFFFTKNHNKEKTDKKSIVPEPSIISFLFYFDNFKNEFLRIIPLGKFQI